MEITHTQQEIHSRLNENKKSHTLFIIKPRKYPQILHPINININLIAPKHFVLQYYNNSHNEHIILIATNTQLLPGLTGIRKDKKVERNEMNYFGRICYCFLNEPLINSTERLLGFLECLTQFNVWHIEERITSQTHWLCNLTRYTLCTWRHFK